jgi:hypothetical protein
LRKKTYTKNSILKDWLNKKLNIKRLVKPKLDYTPQTEINYHCWSNYRINRDIVISVKKPASKTRYYNNLTFVKQDVKGKNIFKVSDIPQIPQIKELLFWTKSGYKTLNDLDHSYTFIQCMILRSEIPKTYYHKAGSDQENITNFAILPVIHSDFNKDLIRLYVNEILNINKNENHFTFIENIYYQSLLKIEKFKELKKLDVFKGSHNFNIDEYFKLKEILKE